MHLYCDEKHFLVGDIRLSVQEAVHKRHTSIDTRNLQHILTRFTVDWSGSG
jgi:hypothetical protein